MLPDGFHWAPRHQYDRQQTALVCADKQVAMLLERVDGSWFARLDCQRPVVAPLVTRSCSSFEAGRAGIEIWACRHEARLRREVADGPSGIARRVPEAKPELVQAADMPATQASAAGGPGGTAAGSFDAYLDRLTAS